MAKRQRKGTRKSRRKTISERSAHTQDLGRGHHIIPRSRGGPDDSANLYHWKSAHHEMHAAWHTLFANFLPSEAIVLIEYWRRKDGGLDLRFFKTRAGKANKRLTAWKILFREMTPDEAIRWIEREFMGDVGDGEVS